MNAAPLPPSDEQADTLPDPVLPTALPVAIAQPIASPSVHPPVDIEGALLVNLGQWAEVTPVWPYLLYIPLLKTNHSRRARKSYVKNIDFLGQLTKNSSLQP